MCYVRPARLPRSRGCAAKRSSPAPTSSRPRTSIARSRPLGEAAGVEAGRRHQRHRRRAPARRRPARSHRGSILRQSYTVLYDDRILREYETVLVRPRFGFDRNAVLAFTGFIRETGERIVAPSLELRCSDAADQPFLDVAVEALADALVAGNRRHFPARSPVRIFTPGELVQQAR